jgi:RHS repeat-associated protein
MGQNIPSHALVLKDQNGNQMLFSSAGLAIPVPLATNTSGSTIIPGDFNVAFAATNGLPSQVPQMSVQQAGGGIVLSGTMPDTATPTSGVAYVDGSHVMVMNSGTSGYVLSYAIAPEGISLPDNTFEYYLKDHLGSTRAVMEEASGGGEWEIIQATNYLAYGMEIPLVTPVVAERSREMFTGKELDEEGTGLNYFGARYYDPVTGMWISCDPKQDSYSPYSYVKGNPQLYTDPNGQFAWLIFLAIAAANGAINVGTDYALHRLTGQNYCLGDAGFSFLAGASVSMLSPQAPIFSDLGKLGKIFIPIACQAFASALCSQADATLVNKEKLTIGNFGKRLGTALAVDAAQVAAGKLLDFEGTNPWSNNWKDALGSAYKGDFTDIVGGLANDFSNQVVLDAWISRPEFYTKPPSPSCPTPADYHAPINPNLGGGGGSTSSGFPTIINDNGD